jgi:predicted HicB family RNase H-like nuclease
MKVLTIRISEELHKALKVKCAMDGTEMNTVVTKLIESYVKGSKSKMKTK